MRAPPPLHAYIILLGAQVAIGAAAIFARYALHGAEPIAVSALRLTIAAAPLLAFSMWRHGKESIPRNHEILFAVAGIMLSLHFASWITSLLYTSVAISTLLVCTTPIWTALYDWIVLKQRTTMNFWKALILAIIGVALIVSSNKTSAPVPGQAWLGDLLATVGSITFAGYLIAIRSVSLKYPTLLIVGRTYSWAAAGLLLAMLIAGQHPPGDDMISWGGIVAMALISQLLGHTGLNSSLRWFQPSTVGFATLLEPVFAAVLAVWIFSEKLSSQAYIGCMMVLVAIFAVLRLRPVESQYESAKDGNEL